MRTDIAPKIKYLKNYEPFNFEIKSVHLDYDLHPEQTRVKSRLELKRLAPGDLELNGADIKLVSVKIDGRTLERRDYVLTQTHLKLANLPDECTLEIETLCDPSKNTTLMGLYVSTGRFCTQCEAQGFRRMTYYPDRPDVMSVFTVRIEAPKADYPFLLSNGNKIEAGDLSDGKHYAIWHDPFRKPCYLFALVAGQFDTLENHFVTRSGRHIPLIIYVDPGDAPKAEYAMDALKRSMRWDEEAFGREYDLDLFMIVAVRDFNFGAMENKGLNIFNSSLLLADAQTATDMNFERIESVVAHEYFHNWSGNRITCRDWFQLCLKEGFTVFRDQEFSAHERGAAVQRIKDVRALRSRQFPEDAGPLAHPVRPDSYEKIDNFYTATVYEKGAELIRMLKTILGADVFRKACDHYFESLDGTAATIEEFITCFEYISGQDLSHFMTWYRQAGTPHIRSEVERNGDNLHIHLEQKTAPTRGQDTKTALTIPVKWQVIYADGAISEPELTMFKTDKMTIDAKVAPEMDCTVSLFQDFSAPVIIHSDNTTADYLRLMQHDRNAFNRWEAGQSIARQLVQNTARAIETGHVPEPDTALRQYCLALSDTLRDNNFDQAFKALALTPPSDSEIMQSMDQSDPIAVSLAGKWTQRAIGDYLRPQLIRNYVALSASEPFDPSAEAAGRRALKNRSLSLLAARYDAEAAHLATAQFEKATNMTDEISALATLIRLEGRRVDQLLEDFYTKWKDNPLVVDKWFILAAGRPAQNPTQHVEALIAHEAYNNRNPNRVRALLGGFAMNNPQGFHHQSGQGYAFFTQQILDMDKLNPQVSARLLGIYEVWRKLDDDRQSLIQAQIQSIIGSDPSPNLREIATKMLG